MPGGDGTGPWWGRGYGCGVGWRRGFGRGFGRGQGMGFGRGFFGNTFANLPEPTRDQEIEGLKSYSSGLEAELSDIKKRLHELEGQK